MDNHQKEQQLEEQHLAQCLKIIQQNIHLYEDKESQYKKEVTELYRAARKGEGDSYGMLVAGRNILEHTQNALRKNRAAFDKAYFGRIDYQDETYGVTERRTYDIQGSHLLGFYDDDVAANDELLVKYLSQNKEAVLGDIIATIQKEQNEIIRDTPFKNIIVQGVAGSGKTTVALHRISYVLYNYEEKYKPSEFCIVGSSDMLLNYISSGLPELDVNHVRQMRMDVFLPYLMGNTWKKKYQIIQEDAMAPVKSKLGFVEALEEFLKLWQTHYLNLDTIKDRELGVLLSRENMEETKSRNPQLSLLQLEKLLNARLASRIKFLCTERREEYRKQKLQEYKKYFHSVDQKWTAQQIYQEFLLWFKGAENVLSHVQKGNSTYMIRHVSVSSGNGF